VNSRIVRGENGRPVAVIDAEGRRYKIRDDQVGAGPDGRIEFTGERRGRQAKRATPAPDSSDHEKSREEVDPA
jgi:hypothetical protein